MEENCSKEILSSMLYRSPYLDPVKSKYFLKRTALRMKDNQNTIQFLQTGKLLCTGKKDRKNKEKERRFRTFADVGGQTWSWKYGHNYQFTTIAAPRRREENRREKQVRVIKGRKCSGKNSRQAWAFILEGLQSRELQKLHESFDEHDVYSSEKQQYMEVGTLNFWEKMAPLQQRRLQQEPQ